MKKALFIYFVLVLVRGISAQQFDLQQLKAEIEGIDQEIIQVKTESSKYSEGLIKALLDTRQQILEYTKAMLEQRLAASTYGIEIKYLVSGSDYTPPSDKKKINLDLENEAITVIKKIETIQNDAKQYSGGLIEAMKLSTFALLQQQLSMIEMKRYSLIYDFPLYALKEIISKPISALTVETTKETFSEIDGMFELKLVGKRVFNANYSDHIGFDFIFINNTDKDINLNPE